MHIQCVGIKDEKQRSQSRSNPIVVRPSSIVTGAEKWIERRMKSKEKTEGAASCHNLKCEMNGSVPEWISSLWCPKLLVWRECFRESECFDAI